MVTPGGRIRAEEGHLGSGAVRGDLGGLLEKVGVTPGGRSNEMVGVIMALPTVEQVLSCIAPQKGDRAREPFENRPTDLGVVRLRSTRSREESLGPDRDQPRVLLLQLRPGLCLRNPTAAPPGPVCRERRGRFEGERRLLNLPSLPLQSPHPHELTPLHVLLVETVLEGNPGGQRPLTHRILEHRQGEVYQSVKNAPGCAGDGVFTVMAVRQLFVGLEEPLPEHLGVPLTICRPFLVMLCTGRRVSRPLAE
mmetsp:Transcript_30986/g.61096  ORF Transcript_30986/g.61096 Transcript_30986/m.61096 type:complete len:251 (-) Transcript_30986:93-845(-)